MSNAGKLLIQRSSGLCPLAQLRSPFKILRDSSRPLHFGLSCAAQPIASRVGLCPSVSSAQTRCFSRTRPVWLTQSPILKGLRPRKGEQEQEERGLAFQEGDLSTQELEEVFGYVHPPPARANALLRVLHGRRYDGTLDLPLSPSMQATLKQYPYAQNSALKWLRQNHYIDEDAAIIDRINREEVGENHSPAELKQRGQDLNVYGPQSGRYQAELSDSGREGDVFGKSELDQIRAANEAKSKKDDEEFQAYINTQMAELKEKTEQELIEAAKVNTRNKDVATRPEQSLQKVKPIREPNEFEKWMLRARHDATSKYTLESPEIANLTFFRRVFPSAVFVALFCVGCYLFAQYWVPPRRADRMYPEISLTYATILGLALVQGAVLLMWRLPGFVKLLNKYMILVTALPRPLSLLGATLSHQSRAHFFGNFIGLLFFGSMLHEEVGRGTFLAIYLASGVCGSLVNLTWYSYKGLLITTSLGASGSVCGILGALCWLNAKSVLLISPKSFLASPLTIPQSKFLPVLPSRLMERNCRHKRLGCSGSGAALGRLRRHEIEGQDRPRGPSGRYARWTDRR
jgi:rhomboid-like protein